MKYPPCIYILLLFLISHSFKAGGESRVALKTNLLYDAALSPNLGVELGVGTRWSVELSGNYNGWRVGGKQWKHWFLQPEVRYWFKERMTGHFMALNIIGGQFNAAFGGERRQGQGLGVGIGYGYSWRIGTHWGIEAELTAGYIHYGYDKYPCARCGRRTAVRSRNYWGPTRAAVNLAYYFGHRDKGTPAEVTVEVPCDLPKVEVRIDSMPHIDFILVDVPHIRVRTEHISGIARIAFAVNRTEIDREIGENAEELDAIVARLDSIRNGLDMDIVSVRITGYASPEGKYSGNDRLAAARTRSLRGYLRNEAGLADSIIMEGHVAEDWKGLRERIAASDLIDRSALLEVIDSDLAPDAKEAALRKFAGAWNVISKNILPELRRTEYVVDYEHRYEERELQTLEEVNRAIRNGDAAGAARLLVNVPSSPEADYARGVVAAMQRRYGEAEGWFERAASRGVGVAEDALVKLKQHKTKLNSFQNENND